MPTLTLEPDEVLPNTPAPLEGEAEGPFAIVWRGKERQLLFRVVELLPKKHVMFAREAGNQATGNWLIYEPEPIIHKPGKIKAARWSPSAPKKIFDNISSEFAARSWALGRFLTFPDVQRKKAIGVLLGDDGVGAWLDQEFAASIQFDFSLSANIFENDRQQVQQFCQRESADPDSTLRFAERWVSHHNSQRATLVLGQRKAEIDQVMRWILLSEPLLWARDNFWFWRFKPLSIWPTDFNHLLCRQGYVFRNLPVDLPFINQASHFIAQKVVPEITAPLRQKHRCTRERLELESFETIVVIEDPPTAYEQLEAALNLRDWLQKHDAPAELLALFRL